MQAPCLHEVAWVAAVGHNFLRKFIYCLGILDIFLSYALYHFSFVSSSSALSVSAETSVMPDDDHEEIFGELEPSRYDIRRDKEEAGWCSLASQLEKGFATYWTNVVHVCCMCREANAIFRCEKCHLLEVCENCLVAAHSHNPPHVVQKWNVSIIYIYFYIKFIYTSHES